MQKHLAMVELLSCIMVRQYFNNHRATLTTGEDVELLARDVVPGGETGTEVLRNYLLRCMGEPIRELQCDKWVSPKE